MLEAASCSSDLSCPRWHRLCVQSKVDSKVILTGRRALGQEVGVALKLVVKTSRSATINTHNAGRHMVDLRLFTGNNTARRLR